MNLMIPVEQEMRKQRAEEEKRKKQELLEAKKAAAQAAVVGGRNFVIDKDANKENSTMDKACQHSTCLPLLQPSHYLVSCL